MTPIAQRRAYCRLIPVTLALALFALAGPLQAQSPFTVPGSLSTTTVIHRFGTPQANSPVNADGFGFDQPLTVAPDGNLYGVAPDGGPNGTGVVFRATRSGITTVLLAFDPLSTAFPATNATGADPEGSLAADPAAAGTFYGTTASGGAYGYGVLFKLVLSGTTATETVLRNFGNPSIVNDGLFPSGSLVVSKGTIYGTVGNDIYSIKTSGNSYAVLHTFDGAISGGYGPSGVIMVNQALYGVAGTVIYKIDTTGAGFTVLFASAPGEIAPGNSLSAAPDGTLYGTYTAENDEYNGLFSLPPSGSFGEILFPNNGATQGSPPVVGSDGNLYGLMRYGTDALTVYEYHLAGTAPSGAESLGDGFYLLNGLPNFPLQPGFPHTYGYNLSLPLAPSLAAAADGSLYGFVNGNGGTYQSDLLQVRPSPGHILTVSKATDAPGSAADPSTLRGAIAAAQPGDAILFSPSLESAENTITLTQGEIVVDKDLNVVFTSSTANAQLTIDAHGVSRAFEISGGVVSLTGLAIFNGYAHPTAALHSKQGGGILVDGGALSLSDDFLYYCEAGPEGSGGEGGGVCVASGYLTLQEQTLVQDCDADYGGGIMLATGPADDLPGAPLSDGAVIDDSELLGCDAGDGAGLFLRGSGPVAAYSVLFEDNGAAGNGGGLYNQGSPETTVNCTFDANQASAGGGIYATASASAGNVDIGDLDTFTSNIADASRTTEALSGDGGAVAVNNGTFSLMSSTLGGPDLSADAATNGPNRAVNDGGGVYVGDGVVSLDDSTLFGDTALSEGGAVFNSAARSSSVFLGYCTIAGNDAAAGGGLYEDSQSGRFNPFQLESTIVAQNTLSGSTAPASGQDVFSAGSSRFTSGGSNLVGNGLGSAGLVSDPNAGNPNSTGNHDQVGNLKGRPVIDPDLGPLKNNGGTENTMAILHGSPALAGSYNTYEVYDERGVARNYETNAPPGQLGSVDIGAFQHVTPYLPAYLAGSGPSFTASTTTGLTVAGPGLLQGAVGDIDAADFPISAVLVSAPKHGVLALAADGSFHYTPASGYQGSDSFQFAVADQDSGTNYVASIKVALPVGKPVTTMTFSPSAPDGQNGWYKSPVTVTLTSADSAYPASELTEYDNVFAAYENVSATYTAPFRVFGDGQYDLSGYCSDPGGAYSPTVDHHVNIDTTPPVTTCTVTEQNGVATVTLKATDNLSGVAGTYYSIGGAPQLIYSNPFLISSTGNVQFSYRSIDVAGNVETAHPTSVVFNSAAPTNVAATAGDQQITVSWTGSAAATKYELERGATSGGPYGLVATVPSNLSNRYSYTDSGRIAGKTYYYVVVAITLPGNVVSAQVDAAPLPATFPIVPTNVVATASLGQIAVTWLPSANATLYEVGRSTAPGGPYVYWWTAPSDQPLKVIDSASDALGYTPGTTYYYVVAAVNVAAETTSAPSAPASAIAE